jgi:membrane associated rhomboid family serine protease
VAEPWTLATSVYAHAGPGHLVANAVALAVVGPLVARRTTRARFHAFFLATGVLAVLAELAVGGFFGQPPVVLGASGAVFALVGYMLSGNVFASAVLDWVGLSRRAKLVVLAVVVVGLTLVTGSSRAALVAHAAGLAVGLVAGRLGVLDVTRGVGRESQQVRDLQRD